jgi:glycerol-3-phosphate dehydrogenase
MKQTVPSRVDLAIIGGGINGAGLAALAANAGLSVVLFEKGDFASGTSSKSTKLIHGGIRYLEQAKFSLVFESLHERRKLLQIAPHLVRPLPFLLPCYKGDARPPWMLKIGLWLYDLLAGSQNIARHRWISADETLQIAPTLKPDGLKGCGLYYDAQVNDARLTMENILAAEAAGATCLNYCPVKQLDQEKDFVRVFYENYRTKQNGVVEAPCLVNASGPWANLVSKMIDENALKLIRPTRGSHIVVPQILSDHAVLITTQKDKRIIFVIPWRGFSLVGTTDLDDPQNPDEVIPTDEEIQYLLEQASRVFPNSKWEKSKVLSAFSGLRTLAWSEGGHASSVSREDKILSNGNVLTIVGGKLTTYRSMALRAFNKALMILKKGSNGNTSFRLPGTPNEPWELFQKENVPKWASTYKITKSQADHLALLYGQRAEQVLELIKNNPRLRKPLHPKRPEILAQVAFAVQKEKAVHLEDVMLRRLEIGYSPQRWGTAPKNALSVMAKLLKWSPAICKKELEQYRQQLHPLPPA